MLLLGIFFASLFLWISSVRWSRFNFIPISPAGLYGLIWGTIWLVHYLDLLDYFPLSDRAVIYSIIPLFGIFIGEQIGLQWNVRKRAVQNVKVYKIYALLKTNNILIILLALLLFATVYSLYGPPWELGVGYEIKMARGKLGISMLKGGFLFEIVKYIGVSRGFIYASMIIAIPVFLVNKKLSLYCFFFSFVAGAINDLCWGSRTLLLDTGIFIVIVFILLRKHMKGIKGILLAVVPKRTLLIGFIVILFVASITIGQIITVSTRMHTDKEIGGVMAPYGIAQLISYYIAPIILFDRTLDHNPVTYGFMSFGGVLNWLYMLRIYRDDIYIYDIMLKWEQKNPMYSKDGSRGNVYSSLRYFYSDFGVLGLFFVPFFIGFLSAIFARRTMQQNSVGFFSYCWLAYCYYIVFRSPLIFPFRVDYIILSVVILVLLSLYVKLHSPTLHPSLIEGKFKSAMQ